MLTNRDVLAVDQDRLGVQGTKIATQGLGVASPSSVNFYLGGNCTALTGTVGIDDAVNNVGPQGGTASFTVRGDGQVRYDSGTEIDRVHVGAGKVRAADRHRGQRRIRLRRRDPAAPGLVRLITRGAWPRPWVTHPGRSGRRQAVRHPLCWVRYSLALTPWTARNWREK
jgi:hypothetical protein